VTLQNAMQQIKSNGQLEHSFTALTFDTMNLPSQELQISCHLKNLLVNCVAK